MFPLVYRNTLKRVMTKSPLYSNVSLRRGACDSYENKPESGERKKGGFAEAFRRHSEPAEINTQEDVTFVSMLRNSKFVDLGDPQGKTVIGKVFHVVGDDLYIDFGYKFHCVCPRPAKNGSDYVRGCNVRLRIKELELSTRFLGSSRDLTLLEADATIIGLVSSPAQMLDNPKPS